MFLQQASYTPSFGGLGLNLEDSADLVEKTNREGFVENQSYRSFRDAVMTATGVLE